MELTVSTWDGPVVRSDETDDPVAEDVQAAIGRLDGHACSEVSLSEEDPFAYITISGGPELYLVTGETADEKILQLTEPGGGDEAISLVTGGQLASYARHDLVTKETATAVALRFLEHGDYDPALPWDIQE